MAILRYDPTRTTMLRRKYESDMRKRFYKIRSMVIQAVWKQDVFGLNESEPFKFNSELTSNQLPERQAWRFRTDSEKIVSFNNWLTNEVAQENLFATTPNGNPWQSTYIDSSYRRGVVRSYSEVNKLNLIDDTDFYQGSKRQFLESSFAQAERTGKIRFLYTRSFEELKGITAAMSQQLSRALASGIANGFGAQRIARELSKTITGITKRRALVLARTELIAAHAEGQLDAFEDLGVKKLGVMAEWSTAGDDLVCDLCSPLEGAVFSIKEARGLIPRHPNCRCAWIPTEADAKRKNKKAVTKSLEAGGGPAKSTWLGKENIPSVTAPGFDPIPTGQARWTRVRPQQEHLNNIQTQYMRKIDRVGLDEWGERALTDEEVMKKLDDIVAQRTQNANIVVRIDDDDLESVLIDGRLKSQFETGTTRGQMGREGIEHRMFSYTDDLPANQRPIYGHLEGDGIINATHQLDNYGENKIYLRNDIRDRTTVSGADTVMNADNTVPLPLEGLDSRVIHPEYLDDAYNTGTLRSTDYLETHVHGGVSVDDIEKVLLERGTDQTELIRLLDDVGVEWDYV